MTIVVTGGIGSGKSAVCGILRDVYGIPVYEADSRVKKLYDDFPGLLEQVEIVVCRKLRDVEGRFMPSVLADVIFNDSDKLAEVEALVFPALKADYAGWKKDHDSVHHVFESATLLEKPQFDGFGDMVLLVDAPFGLRLERAAVRDGRPRDLIMQRMMNQKLMNRLSEGDSDPRIDHVIINDGTVQELEVKVAEFMKNYRLT